MKKVIINSIKVSIAVAISVILANVLQLDFAISAGIVAILTIAPTKKETVKIAFGRLLAFVFALAIAFISFKIVGINQNGFLLFILPYAFVCYLNKWTAGLAMNSVLISHFLTLGCMNVETVVNECLIFAIGVGVGIIVNLHLRKDREKIEILKEKADEQIVHILSRMGERITNKNLEDYNGECFKKLEMILRNAKNTADENAKNEFGNKRDYDMEYIAMRERQCVVLFEMYKMASSLKTKPQTASYLSEFMKDMAMVFHRDNDCKLLMEKFRKMDEYMKQQPLPINRQEFEDRARLFMLMRNIEEFIEIKLLFAEMDAKK